MATRSSARLAALSPPPPLPPRTDTVMTRSSGRPSVASEIWTGQQVEEFKAAFLDVSNVQDILKPEFVPGVNGHYPLRAMANGRSDQYAQAAGFGGV